MQERVILLKVSELVRLVVQKEKKKRKKLKYTSKKNKYTLE